MIPGPGNTDSNGVYHLGEGDNPDGTFSGLIGLVTGAISTAIGLVRGRLDALEAPRYCTLRKSSNQALATAAAAVTWDVEISDLAGMHSTTSNTSRIVVPQAGLYEITTMCFDSSTTGFGTVYARVNGTTDVAGSLARRDVMAGNVSVPILSVSVVQLAANDYIEIMALHSVTGGAVQGGSGIGGSYVAVRRIGG